MVAPSTQVLLTDWTWPPSIVLGLLLVSGAYAYAVGPLRRRRSLGPPPGRGRIVSFVLSNVVLIFALLSPLDIISDEYLFSAHMVQHLLLASLWPPLILLALPPWLVRPLFRQPALNAVLGFLTLPVMAIFLFFADIYAWHLPGLYDLTLSDENVHILEHLSFMALGVLNWWPVLSPLPEQRLSYPLQILYLFVNGMFMMVLGIVFTFSPIVFYSAYRTAPRLWGISASADQQLGGLIMWYPGNLPYAVLLCISFYRWFDAGESAAPEVQSQSPTIGRPTP